MLSSVYGLYFLILFIIHNVNMEPGDKSKEMCKVYAESVYGEEDSPILLPGASKDKISQCGIVEVPLIIGGEEAASKEFPHMAVIGYGWTPDEELSWHCGATLISEKFILTAAHCMQSRDKGPSQKVRLGELQLDSTDDETVVQEILIAEKIPHPNYKLPAKYHDIALMKLAEPAKFDAFVRPACLNTKATIKDKKGIATGFGRLTYEAAEGSSKLMKVQLSFIPTLQCNSSFETDIRRRASVMKAGIIDSQICAGELVGGKDTCQGDSGGPLQVVLEEPYCMYSIIGVTSFGKFCGFANSPAIYSRVSYYISWIEKEVWGVD